MAKKELSGLRPGVQATLQRTVEFRWTIASYDRRLPPVLSTPAMIGLMESAAAQLLKPYLPKGSISVGTHINVSHRAPAGVGARVRFTAELIESNESRYHFAVRAETRDTLLGDGSVERAIVDLNAFAARFKARAKKARG